MLLLAIFVCLMLITVAVCIMVHRYNVMEQAVDLLARELYKQECTMVINGKRVSRDDHEWKEWALSRYEW